jgi:hypothetical protein
MPRLLSVNVGLPRDVTWNSKTVRTAIWKSPVEGRRMARKLDIDGDAQGDQCAGALMWTCVTIVYLMAGTILAMRLLSPEKLRDAKLLPTLHVKAAPASFQQSSEVF